VTIIGVPPRNPDLALTSDPSNVLLLRLIPYCRLVVWTTNFSLGLRPFEELFAEMRRNYTGFDEKD
jgi:hypothetical protein